MDELSLFLPLAKPPWTALGRRLESMCRKALFDFSLVEGVNKLAIALSGGKDSLGLLYLLKALAGRGFPEWELYAIHVDGEFSCGAGIGNNFLRPICRELGVEYIRCEAKQTREKLECYSCSRERRKLIFEAARQVGATTIAFGHHREDNIQTLLMNLLHKGEFAGMLPKVPMHDYGVTIIRPLIYISEGELQEFARLYQFARLTCQCPAGQESLRANVKKMMKEWELLFPNLRGNLASASLRYGSQKALEK